MEGRLLNKTLEQLREEFINAPTNRREYIIDGKKYVVISHYTGDKDINEVLQRVAVNRAYREMGL